MLRTHVPDGLSWQVFETCLSILWCVPGPLGPRVGWVTGSDLIPAACGSLLPGSINRSLSSGSRPPGPCDKAWRGQLCPPRIPFFPFFPLHWFFLRFHFSRGGVKSTIHWVFLPPSPLLHLTFVITFLHLGCETERSWESCQSRSIAVPSKRANFLFSNLEEEVSWWNREMRGEGAFVLWLRDC